MNRLGFGAIKNWSEIGRREELVQAGWALLLWVVFNLALLVFVVEMGHQATPTPAPAEFDVSAELKAG